MCRASKTNLTKMTEDQTNYHLFDTELILDYLDGILMSDVHQKIKRELESSLNFNTFVEGVEMKYNKAGRNRKKMADLMEQEKSASLSKFRNLLHTKPNPIQASLRYTAEQLKQFFAPLPRYELMLTTRSASLLSNPKPDADITDNLSITFQKTTSSPTQVTVINNENTQVISTIIPIQSDNYIIPINQLRHGVYYLNLNNTEGNNELIRFYIGKEVL